MGLGRAALAQVAGDGERRAGESDQRDLELIDQPPHGLEHVRRVVAGVQRSEPVQVSRRGEGLGDHRSDPRFDRDAEPDGRGRHDDVGVQDGGVDAVAPDGLEGDLHRPIGVGDGIEDRSGAAHLVVLGQRAAGLSHEPDGGGVDGLASAGAEEAGVPAESRVGTGGRDGHRITVCGPSRRHHPASDRRGHSGTLSVAFRSRCCDRALCIHRSEPLGALAIHPDHEAEQAYLDRAYACLEANRQRAVGPPEHGRGGPRRHRTGSIRTRCHLGHRPAAPPATGSGRPVPGVRAHRPRGRGPGHRRRRRAGRDLLHRPDRRLRRDQRSGGRRLAGSGGRAVLPGDGPGTHGPVAAATLHQPGPDPAGARGRVLRRCRARTGSRRDGRRRAVGAGRAGGRHRGAADRRARRHRRHDPGRTGPDHPGRPARGPGGPGRTRDGQDRRRTASGRLPALHPPVPARGSGGPRRRPQPAVPRLHRAGAPLPGRSGRRAGRVGRSGGRRARRGSGVRRRRPDQG